MAYKIKTEHTNICHQFYGISDSPVNRILADEIPDWANGVPLISQQEIAAIMENEALKEKYGHLFEAEKGVKKGKEAKVDTQIDTSIND